jgi:hypothetical protein
MTGFIIRTEASTQKVAHLMNLEDYRVTKKWVIIDEISKEDENNNITRLNVYSKYYVPPRPRVGEVGRPGVLDQMMVALEDHIQVVVVLDVLDVVREYTFIVYVRGQAYPVIREKLHQD